MHTESLSHIHCIHCYLTFLPNSSSCPLDCPFKYGSLHFPPTFSGFAPNPKRSVANSIKVEKGNALRVRTMKVQIGRRILIVLPIEPIEGTRSVTHPKFHPTLQVRLIKESALPVVRSRTTSNRSALRGWHCQTHEYTPLLFAHVQRVCLRIRTTNRTNAHNKE